jgi:hypothetical protein
MLALEFGAATYWQLLDAETWVRQFIHTNKCTIYTHISYIVSILTFNAPASSSRSLNLVIGLKLHNYWNYNPIKLVDEYVEW